jgi:hypothetical protein
MNNLADILLVMFRGLCGAVADAAQLFYFIEFSQRCKGAAGAGDFGAGMFSPAGSAARLGRGVTLADFNLIKVIGQGSFGKVFLVKPNWRGAEHKPGGNVFAMKVGSCRWWWWLVAVLMVTGAVLPKMDGKRSCL